METAAKGKILRVRKSGANGENKPFHTSLKVLRIGLKDMAYKKKTWKFRRAIEVMEYHTARYGAPGQKREKKRKPTKEDMEKVNQYTKERKARHKLRTYFYKNDYFSCLTYAKDARPPDMQAAKKDWSDALRIIRREYKKRGVDTIYWMRNIEVGTKGAWHIHLVINRIPDTDIILKKAWTKGKVMNQLLYERGEFRELAAYITKTPRTDSRLRESDFMPSRNMPIPEPIEKTYFHWKSWNKIKIPEGYYLEKETIHEGKNPITGHSYRTYTLIKLGEDDIDREDWIPPGKKKKRKKRKKVKKCRE